MWNISAGNGNNNNSLNCSNSSDWGKLAFEGLPRGWLGGGFYFYFSFSKYNEAIFNGHQMCLSDDNKYCLSI